jgi:bifunctional non-homologous end joining protein LigD
MAVMPGLRAALARKLRRLGAAARTLRTRDVRLMLAGTTAVPFDREGWIFELKYDGFRLLAANEDGRARLRYRGGSDATAAFPEVAAALAALPRNVVLDGEVVVVDEAGRTHFQRMQQRLMLRRPADVARAAAGRLRATFFAFDLLGLEGYDLRALPLRKRKDLLRGVLPRAGALRYVDHVEGRGVALHEAVRKLDLEGLVAKRASAPYAAGRSSDWIKLPVVRTGEFVVVGFTRPGLGMDGGLHLAVRDRAGLVYAGRVGSGLGGRLAEVRDTLAAFRRAEAACAGAPRGRDHTWVDPRVVCEVRYRERTEEGLLRHPVFVRFRPERSAGRPALRSARRGRS